MAVPRQVEGFGIGDPVQVNNMERDNSDHMDKMDPSHHD